MTELSGPLGLPRKLWEYTGLIMMMPAVHAPCYMAFTIPPQLIRRTTLENGVAQNHGL